MIERYNIQGQKYLIFKYFKTENNLTYFLRLTAWKKDNLYFLFIHFQDGSYYDCEEQSYCFNELTKMMIVINEWKTMFNNI